MKTIRLLFPVLFIVLFSCQQTPEEYNTLTEKEIADGWILLFDGETMDHWRSYLKDELTGWKVEDATMKALGLGGDEGGDIITLKEYEDFELSLEWKIPVGGNSGILYMVHEDTAYHEVYHTGPEYQLWDDAVEPDKDKDEMAASNYDMQAAENPDVKPAGEWNTARIIKDGPHVEQWLNGKKVVEYELWSDDWKAQVEAGKWKKYPGYGKYERGHISLQDHGTNAWFRNIKIREL